MTLRILHIKNFVISFLLLENLKPKNILLSLLFLLPFLGFTKNEDLNLFKHIFFRVAAITVFVLTLFQILSERPPHRLPKTGIEKYLLLYVLSILLSTVIGLWNGTASQSRSLTSLFTVPILISLLYTIPYWIDSKSQIERSIRVLLLSQVLVCLIGLLEVANNFSIFDTRIYRVRSVFHDPNILARYLVIGIFFIISLLQHKVKNIFSVWFLYFTLVLSLLNLILTFSRSSYITFIIGFIIYSYFYLKGRKRFIYSLSVAVIGFVLIVLAFILRAGGETVFDPSNINRLQLLMGGLNIIENHPLVGIGYSSFANYYETVYLEGYLSISSEIYKSVGLATEIHNWLIEIWSEQGVIGIIVFMLLFVKIFRIFTSALQQTGDTLYQSVLIGYIMMFYVYLFHGFFYHTFITQFVFWIMAGFGVSVVNTVKATATPG